MAAPNNFNWDDPRLLADLERNCDPTPATPSELSQPSVEEEEEDAGSDTQNDIMSEANQYR
jgi:hypothetical protein